MRPGKDLDNKPIVSVSDGQILGRTKDVYVNQDLTELAGLFIGTEGVIRRTERIIPNDSIVLFGIDVILVQNSDVITTTKAVPESDNWHRLSRLRGQEVRTPGGTKLATIGDLILDEQGAVSEFSLDRVFVTGPLSERPIIPRDVIIDPFQTSDGLIVDFPKLEAMFTEPQKEEAAVDSDELVQDAGDKLDTGEGENSQGA